MIDWLLSFFKPTCYDLFLVYTETPKEEVLVDVLSSVLEIETLASEYIIKTVKENKQWCIASSKSRKTIEKMQSQCKSKGLKTFIEIN